MEAPLPPNFDGPLRFGSLELPSRFLLAPLAGYTNLPLRLSIRELGGLGLATTDLVNARALRERKRKTMELIATCPEDRPFAVQIFGAEPEEMSEAARWLEGYGATSVDINMGCPVRKVVRTGGGSALLCDTGSTTALVRRIVQAVKIPVTVKMRLGWDADNHSAPDLARMFEGEGVAAVTIHGRTRQQGFGGDVSLDGIRAVVEAVDRMPIVGNGDVRTIVDADRMFRETGCAAIAIGRGALANPWIFRQLTSWLQTGRPGPRALWLDRLRFMRTHFLRLVELRGEHMACLQFRKVATWYTRALRTPREIQQTLVMLDSVERFDQVWNQVFAEGEPTGWSIRDAEEPRIPVPSGPVSHW